VEGLLQDFNLTELLQLFEMTNASGALQLLPIGYEQQEKVRQAAIPFGLIFFESGKVTDAQLGPLQGQEALFSLFLWRAGTFRFHKEARSSTQTIHQANESLLLEGVRRIDEWTSILERVPTLQVILFRSPQLPLQAQSMQISEAQWNLLRVMNGRDPLILLAGQCQLSSFHVRVFAARLLSMGLAQRCPPTGAEEFFEALVRAAAKDLGELAEPLVERIFAQVGCPPGQLSAVASLPPAFAARILPQMEATAARYIGPHRAQRLKQRLMPIAQPA
jgi:hypothetical protein